MSLCCESAHSIAVGVFNYSSDTMHALGLRIQHVWGMRSVDDLIALVGKMFKKL